MTNEELNQAVYDKIQDEFKTYEAELQALPASEALLHAFEYSTKEDIIMAFDDIELTDAQCEALLNIPDPLNQLFDEYFNRETGYMQDLRDCIIDRCNYEKMLQENKEHSGNFDKLHLKLGLYNQVNAAYPRSMDESRVYGIAIQAFKDGEPYGAMTVNLQNQITGDCEMIGIKNAAYIDTNNFPWATLFIEKGFATDTGFTKRSGFFEYPLYRFDESWLKSLKPLEPGDTLKSIKMKYQNSKRLRSSLTRKILKITNCRLSNRLKKNSIPYFQRKERSAKN